MSSAETYSHQRLEIARARRYSNVHRHGRRHDGDRHVHRPRRVNDDFVFRTLGRAIHFPGHRHIIDSDIVSRTVIDVAATQPQILWLVLRGCNGVAGIIHFYNVEFFS